MTRHDPERWLRIVAFVEDYIRDHGYGPSYDEIGAGVGLHSKSAVRHHLVALGRDGLLAWETGVARSVRPRGVCEACGRGW